MPGSGAPVPRRCNVPMETVADLRGTLEEFPLDAVVTLLAASSHSGALHFTGLRPAVVHFVDGQVCEPGDDEDDCREQVVTALFEQLLMGDAFEFRQGEAPPDGPSSRFPADGVLTAACRRMEQWREIAAAIPSTAAVLRLSSTLPGRKTKTTITAEEWEVVARVDGRTSIHELTLALDRDAFEMMLLLHKLIRAGLVEVCEDDPDA